MRKIRHPWHVCAGLAAVAVLTALTLTALTPAAPPDPVEELRQALPMRPEDMRKATPAILQHRDETLKKLAKQLQTVSELRRALALSEWKEQPSKDKALVQIETAVRNDIGARFKLAIERIVEDGDSTSRLAVANMIAELGPNVRALKLDGKEDPGGFTRTLAPVLVKLAREARDDKTKRSLAVRQEALRALGSVNADPQIAVPALQEALRDAEPGPRRVAADALVQMIKVVSHLVKRTRSDTGVDATPADVVTTTSLVLAASRTGLKDPDPQVVALTLDATRDAATALGELVLQPEQRSKYPPPGRALTELERKEIKAKYDAVLGEFRFLSPLLDEMNKQAKAILEVIQRRNDAGQILPNANGEGEVKLSAIDALEHISFARLRLIRRLESVPLEGGAKRDLEQFDPLKDLLADPMNIVAVTHLLREAPQVRRRTVEFLEMVGDKATRSIPALIAHMNDPDRFVRWGAARALGHINPAESAGAIAGLGRLLEDPDLNVRQAAAATLEVFGGIPALQPGLKAAVPFAARAVNSSNTDVRLAAMYALLSFGPEVARPAAPALAEALNPDISPDPKVRAAAAEVLGKLGPKIFLDPQTNQVDREVFNQVIAALRHAIGDEDNNVRAGASDALLSLLPPPPKK
jgi:HEAT repeat protein